MDHGRRQINADQHDERPASRRHEKAESDEQGSGDEMSDGAYEVAPLRPAALDRETSRAAFVSAMQRTLGNAAVQ